MLLHRSLRTIAQRVRSVLRKYGTNAHMYIAGVGPVKGFTPGNYVESTGVTPATVDQPVGLVKDAANVTGGIDASQSTSGFRPVERRGIVNNYTYSHDARNAAYTKTNITVSAPGGVQKITPNAGTAQHYVSKTYTAVSGNAYTKAVAAKADGFDWVWLYGSNPVDHAYFNVATGQIGNVTGGTATIAQDSDGYYVCTLSCTATGAAFAFETHSVASNGGGSTTTGDGTKGTLLKACAMFDGTLTASQILAMGGIPMATTAAASSAMGPYYLQFYGTDDWLVTGIAPFTIGDDFCVVISAKLAPNATTRYLFNMGAGAGGQMVGAVYTTAAGIIGARWADDAATAHSIASATSFAEQTVVISTISRSGTRSLKVNGVQVGSSSSALGTATVSSACIGDWKSGGGNYFNGNIYACIPIKGTLTDAEITLLENQAAASAGGRLVGGAFVSNY